MVVWSEEVGGDIHLAMYVCHLQNILHAGGSIQVPAVFTVCFSRCHTGEEEIWSTGVQHPLRVHRRRPKNLHQPAKHVSG